MAFKLVRNDLTKMRVDVIVNPANRLPVYASGTDSAVYHAAGKEALLSARAEIGILEEGDVAITPGFDLYAQYIIHAVSPRYLDGKSGEEEKLRRCYRNSLKLAVDYQCYSIAFPLISTGSFGYPKEEGLRIALDEIHAFTMKHDLMVYLVVFDEQSTSLAQHLDHDLQMYIDAHYVQERLYQEMGAGYPVPSLRKPKRSNRRVYANRCEAMAPVFWQKRKKRASLNMSRC